MFRYRKLVFSAILLASISLSATAQTSSPTFQNLTVNGTAKFNGPVQGYNFNLLFGSPPPIGNVAPGTGAFATLGVAGSATLTGPISGSGVTNLFASPPPIGGSTPSAGSFTTLNASGGGTLQNVNLSSGLVSTANVTANSQTYSLATWISYLNGTANPNAVSFGNQINITSTPPTAIGSIINNVSTYSYPANGTNDRPRYWMDILTLGADSSGIHEGNFFSVILSGAHTASNETNVVHAYVENDSVNFSGGLENFEASTENFAYVGNWQNYLATNNNTSTGTASAITGVRFLLNNANTTPGAIGSSAALSMEAMTGGGSLPTYYYFVVNKDPNAVSGLSGNVVIGTFVPQGNQALTVIGPDTSGSTYPVVMQNSSGTRLLYMSDSGNVYVPGNLLSGLTTVTGPDTGDGTYPLSVKNSAGTNMLYVSDAGNVHIPIALLAGSTTITGADTSGGTYPLFVKNSVGSNLFYVSDNGTVYAPVNFNAGITAIAGTDTSGGTYPLSVKNSSATNLFSVSDSGAIVAPGVISLGITTISGTDTGGGTYPLVVKDGSGTNLFFISDAGGLTYAGAGLKISNSSNWSAASNCGSLASSTKCLGVLDPNGNTVFIPVYGTF